MNQWYALLSAYVVKNHAAHGDLAHFQWGIAQSSTCVVDNPPALLQDTKRSVFVKEKIVKSINMERNYYFSTIDLVCL